MPQDTNEQLEKVQKSLQNVTGTIKVYNEVGADAAKVTGRFADAMDSSQEISTKFNKSVSSTNRRLGSLEKRIGSFGSSISSVSGKISSDLSGITSAVSGVSGGIDSLNNLKVDVDVSKTIERISEIEDKINALSKSKIKIDPDIDVSKVLDRISEVEKKIKTLGDKKVKTPKIDTPDIDTSKIKSSLIELQDMISNLGGSGSIDKKDLDEIADKIEDISAIKGSIDIEGLTELGIKIDGFRNSPIDIYGEIVLNDADVKDTLDSITDSFGDFADGGKGVGEDAAKDFTKFSNVLRKVKEELEEGLPFAKSVDEFDELAAKVGKVDDLEKYIRALGVADKAILQAKISSHLLADANLELTDAFSMAKKELIAMRPAIGVIDDLREKQNEYQKAARDAADATDSASKAAALQSRILADLTKATADFISKKDQATKTSIAKAFEDTGGDIGKTLAVIGKLGKQYPQLGAQIKKIKKVNAELADQFNNLGSEVDSFAGVVKNKLREGTKEAEGFLGGLGKNATGLTAVGVGLLFISSKAADLIDKTKGMAIEFSGLNIEIAKLSATTFLPGGAQQLENIRDSLNITKNETQAFSDLLTTGVNKGVISIGALVVAGEQLKDTFGGSQLENLKEYVSLLEQIPTLETDLSVTASVDDRTASIFALAEAGKIEGVIELQSAGLLGGIETEIVSDRDKDLLNSAKGTEKFIEDIHRSVSGFFPVVGPQIAGIASTAVKVIGGVLGVAAVTIGGFGMMRKKQDKIIDQLDSINKGVRDIDGGDGGGGDAGGFNLSKIKKMFPSVSKAGSKIGSKLGVDKLTSSIKDFATKGGGFATAVRQSVTAGIGGALGAGGGATISAGIAGAGGAAATTGIGAGIAGFSAAATMFVAPLVAAVGPLALLAVAGQSVGGKFMDVGDNLEEVGGILGKFGGAIDWTGKQLANAGAYWESKFKDAGNFINTLGGSFNVVEKEVDKAAEELSAANKRIQKDQRDSHRSALALQKSLGLINIAAGTAKVQLADLGAEVAGMKLQNLALVGGSAQEFASATSQGARSVTDSFNTVQDGFKRARSFIIRNGDLDASARRAALLKLQKAELDATKKFVEGLIGAIGNFDQIPGVVSAALEQSIRQVSIDVQMDAGAGFGDVVGDIAANLEASFGALGEATAQLNNQFAVGDQQAEAFAKSMQISSSDFESEMSNMSKQAGDMGKNIAEKLSASVDLSGGNVSVTNVGAVQEIAAEQQAEVDNISDQINSLVESLGSADIRKVNKEFDSIKKEWADANKILSDIREESQGLNDETDKFKELQKEADSQLERLSEIGSRRRQTAIELASLDDQFVSIGRKRAATQGKEVKDKEALKKLGKEAVQQNEEIIKDLEKKRISAEANVRVTNSLLSVGEAQLVAEREREKILQKYAEVVKSIFAQTNALIGNLQNDPSIQLAQSSLDRAESLVELNTAMGATELGILGLFDKRKNLAAKQVDVSKKTVAELNKIKEGDVTEVLSRLGESLSGSISSVLGKIAETGTDTSSLDKMGERTANALQNFNDVYADKNSTPEKIEKAASAFQKARDNFAKAATVLAKQSGEEIDISSPLEGLKIAGVVVGASAGNLEKALNIANAALNRAQKDFVQSFDVEGDLAKIDSTAISESSQATKELSLAQLEYAAVAGPLGGILKNSATGLNAVNRAFEESQKRVAETAKKAVQMGKIIANLKKSLETEGNPQERKKIAQTIYALEIKRGKAVAQINKRQVEDAKKRDEGIIAIAQKRRDIELDRVGIAQEVVDLQEDFLGEIGAPFGTIFALQKESVRLEQMKLDSARQYFEELKAQGLTGIALEKARAGVIKQEVALEKKVLGAQRSTFEKLAGMAFGALQGVGAQQQVGTLQHLIGNEGTRFKTRAGFLRGVGEGEGGPNGGLKIEDRALELQMARGTGGSRGRRPFIDDLADRNPERAPGVKELTAAASKTESAGGVIHEATKDFDSSVADFTTAVNSMSGPATRFREVSPKRKSAKGNTFEVQRKFIKSEQVKLEDAVKYLKELEKAGVRGVKLENARLSVIKQEVKAERERSSVKHELRSQESFKFKTANQMPAESMLEKIVEVAGGSIDEARKYVKDIDRSLAKAGLTGVKLEEARAEIIRSEMSKSREIGSGDRFKHETAKTVATSARDARNARLTSRGQETSASGLPSFLGGAVASAQAQINAGVGVLPTSETRGETIDRMKSKFTEEKKSKTSLPSDFSQNSLVSVQTPETRKKYTEDRKEQLIALQNKYAKRKDDEESMKEVLAGLKKEGKPEAEAMTAEIAKPIEEAVSSDGVTENAEEDFGFDAMEKELSNPNDEVVSSDDPILPDDKSLSREERFARAWGDDMMARNDTETAEGEGEQLSREERVEEAFGFKQSEGTEVAEGGVDSLSREDQVEEAFGFKQKDPLSREDQVEEAFGFKQKDKMATSPQQQTVGSAPKSFSTEQAGRLGAGGGGAVEPRAESKVQVQAEISVKFDSRMFKDEVIQIMREHITDGEVIRTLGKQFVRGAQV